MKPERPKKPKDAQIVAQNDAELDRLLQLRRPRLHVDPRRVDRFLPQPERDEAHLRKWFEASEKKRLAEMRRRAQRERDLAAVKQERDRLRAEADREAVPHLSQVPAPPAAARSVPLKRCIHRVALRDCRYCTPGRYGQVVKVRPSYRKSRLRKRSAPPTT